MGPLRVSNVLRPDNRVAEPWVGQAQWPRRVLGAVGAWHILRAAGLLLRVAYSVDVRAPPPIYACGRGVVYFVSVRGRLHGCF